MKCHIGVDAGSGLVHAITVTARMSMTSHRQQICCGKMMKWYMGIPAISEFRSAPEVTGDEHLASIGYRINCRPGKLPHVVDNAIDWKRCIENRKCSVRCKVEHVFWIIKCQFGYKKMMYRGLMKNENRLYAMFACANLYALAIAGQKPPQPDIGTVCSFLEKEQTRRGIWAIMR